MKKSVSLGVALAFCLPAAVLGQTSHQKALEHAMVQSIRSVLRDPGSLHIVSASLVHATDAAGQPRDVLCGTLVARNGMGGMSPAVRFMFDPTTKRTALLEHTYRAVESVALETSTAEIDAMVYGRFCQGGR